MATIASTYRLKPESTLSTIRPDETLLAAPLRVWKKWVPQAVLDNHRSKVQELEAAPDSDALEEDLDKKRKQITTLRNEKEVQENRFLALEKSVATLMESVATQKDEITTLKKTVATQKDEITTLKESVATLEESVATLQESVATLEESVATLEESVATQKDEITRKRKKINDGRAEGKTAEEALSARVTALEQKMQAWEKSLEDVAEEAKHISGSTSTPTPSSSTSSSCVRVTRSAGKRARHDE